MDLSGAWERHVNGKLFDIIPVPSSQRPLGFYHLKREFLLPALSGSERAILHFEAITYHGRVFVNGAELGTMGPYIPYEFEFTKQAKEGRNSIDVAIADLSQSPSGAGKDEIALGVNPGWEAYGGIIRDVYVELRPAAYIENVRLGYGLSDGIHEGVVPGAGFCLVLGANFRSTGSEVIQGGVGGGAGGESRCRFRPALARSR